MSQFFNPSFHNPATNQKTTVPPQGGERQLPPNEVKTQMPPPQSPLVQTKDPRTVLTHMANQPRPPLNNPDGRIAQHMQNFYTQMPPAKYAQTSQKLSTGYQNEFGKAPTPGQTNMMTDKYMEKYHIGQTSYNG